MELHCRHHLKFHTGQASQTHSSRDVGVVLFEFSLIADSRASLISLNENLAVFGGRLN